MLTRSAKVAGGGGAPGSDAGPPVWIDDPRAADHDLVGSKGSHLALARRAGLPVLPGFVLDVTTSSDLAAPRPSRLVLDPVHRAWRELSQEGARPLVVRSSSPIEDTERSSMAGRFTSVLDVRGWDAFLDAVRTVVASRDLEQGEAPAAMAVLVQPFVVPAVSGVLFGAHPVTGARDRLLVAAVDGGPDRLVAGDVDGVQLTLGPRGRLLERHEPPGGGGPELDRRVRRRLAVLARRAAEAHGGPQDIEWAVMADGALVLFQTRPITALAASDLPGPDYGPGPVTETFPAPLTPLEQDLWVDPLRDALRAVLRLLGAAPRRPLATAPLVTVLDGRVAVDLDIIEGGAGAGRVRRIIDPRPPLRRLRVAWLVGRLTHALPRLASRVLREVDEQLAAVPDLRALSVAELLGVLERTRRALVAVQGYEQLTGQLVAPGGTSAVAEALRSLAACRVDGLDDEAIRYRRPITLMLVPPSVGPPAPLPPVETVPPMASAPAAGDLLREGLRVRARVLQELGARAAVELGRRLADRGVLADPVDVRWLRLDELRHLALARSDGAVELRRSALDHRPLPARFRIDAGGRPVATLPPAVLDGRGAGGGVGEGIVHQGGSAPEGAVLVVRTLDLGLAPVLSRLGGLVAETGSVLSHVAILARELEVPTVVGVPGALERYPIGVTVRVDGRRGTVEVLEPDGRSTSSVREVH